MSSNSVATSRGRRFQNSEPSEVISLRGTGPILVEFVKGMKTGLPAADIPLSSPDLPDTPADLAVTWLGHATALIELDGHRILVDPIWSERCSPSHLVGPARLHPMPMAIEELPEVDVIVISHDHYDHLDKQTILDLARLQEAPFFVPIGVGSHLRRWGVPSDRIEELDWNQAEQVAGLTVTCTEARHFSGRGLVRNTTLWASWAFAGMTHKVFFGGDSGFTQRFSDTGRTLGPFDLTLLPIGAYDGRWPDIHMNPEEAVAVHALLCGSPQAGMLIPIHWATFNLAFHRYTEPVERLLAAAEKVGTSVRVPLPGQRTDLSDTWDQKVWWDGLSRP
ncbi:MBL fold metallo-hydrolase [Smaragdicoccus niigatensis]|uniref:MBL fold metallo-hydrolase n=1 Tax=Smaragdicoccus niigatensis TaxID=359359 RepID=UPI000A911A55